jgi:hypothetical protein
MVSCCIRADKHLDTDKKAFKLTTNIKNVNLVEGHLS